MDEAVIKKEEAEWALWRPKVSQHCQHVGFKKVLQINWQKIVSEVNNILVTYNNTFGPGVRAFLEQISVQQKVWQMFSIVVRKLKNEDLYEFLKKEGNLEDMDYMTCLRLYEKFGPVLDVFTSSYPAGSVPGPSQTSDGVPWIIGGIIAVLLLALLFFNRKVITAKINLLGMSENELPENGEQNV